MVITVDCPSCSTSFPVDTTKVPERGIKVRCSACAGVFRVERPEEADAPFEQPSFEAPAAAEEELGEAELPSDWVIERPRHEEPVAFEEAPASDATFETDLAASPEEPMIELPEVEAPDEPVAAAEPEPVPTPEPPAPEPGQPATAEPSAPVQGFTFGKRDPSEKARRLARVLVSDMIMYNPERHEKALAEGTLKEDFEDEIEKSWKEYVEQVGEEMAEGEGRGFWSEALNDVLARGRELF